MVNWFYSIFVFAEVIVSAASFDIVQTHLRLYARFLLAVNDCDQSELFSVLVAIFQQGKSQPLEVDAPYFSLSTHALRVYRLGQDGFLHPSSEDVILVERESALIYAQLCPAKDSAAQADCKPIVNPRTPMEIYTIRKKSLSDLLTTIYAIYFIIMTINVLYFVSSNDASLSWLILRFSWMVSMSVLFPLASGMLLLYLSLSHALKKMRSNIMRDEAHANRVKLLEETRLAAQKSGFSLLNKPIV
jgi:hypothetical protein